jgi:helix-turn-helix protein
MVRLPIAAARRTTMSYTLAEAAAACGLDKSTVRRAVRSGRISGTRDDLGVWHVEAAELHRVFPPAVRLDDDTPDVTRDAPLEAAGITTDALVAELRAVIADLRADRERDRVDHNGAMTDLRADRDHWRGIAERLSLSGPKPDQQPTVTPAPADSVPSATRSGAPPSRLRRAWRWMRATG